MMTKAPKLTRQERGQVRRAINQLNTIEARSFPSESNPAVVYETVMLTDGKLMCNCRGWIVKKKGRPRECKHTIELLAGRPTRRDDEFVYRIAREDP